MKMLAKTLFMLTLITPTAFSFGIFKDDADFIQKILNSAPPNGATTKEKIIRESPGSSERSMYLDPDYKIAEKC